MMNKRLNKRYEKSYQSRKSGFGGNVMKFDGVEFFSPSVGKKNNINIIPYEIKTKNHPMVARGEFEIGDMDYVMDCYVHKNIGVMKSSALCLRLNYGKPCPICEQAERFKKEGKEDEAKALNPTRRVFYNVEDLNDPGKVKIFETSHYLFEKELIEEARDDEEGGFIDFADPKEGKEIKFRASDVQKGTIKYKEFRSFTFEDRDKPISNKLLESAISFDEIMEVPTYAELDKLLNGNTEEEDDDDENYDEPNEEEEINEKKKPVAKEEDDEDEDEEEEEKTKSNKCPFGHKFGKDCDKFDDDCDKCDDWKECYTLNAKNKGE